jgi:hypothetical protein
MHFWLLAARARNVDRSGAPFQIARQGGAEDYEMKKNACGQGEYRRLASTAQRREQNKCDDHGVTHF